MVYHLIGIGGIGMSALARVLSQRGVSVQGSDLKQSPLLESLALEGIGVQIGHSAKAIREGMTIVYSTDIQEENVEWKEAKRLGLPFLHRSDLLDAVMKDRQPLLVTGTHGKTTTTSLLASVLIEAGVDPSFVVGGILKELNTNGKSGQGSYFVAEADESDGSFLKTPYFGAIVTNLDKEHLSYWKTEERLREGFKRFFKKALNFDHLFWCRDDLELASLSPPGFSYGFHEMSDVRIDHFRQTAQGIEYDLYVQGSVIKRLEVSLYGSHNALNSAAVCSLALSLGIAEEKIRRALRSFKGAKRRLDKIGVSCGIEIYDDYGHHPTEIEVTLRAFRALLGSRRLVAFFQPHRYSRVKDLFDRFVSCFDAADLIVLTDIYSAGEAPIKGISTQILFERMQKRLGPKICYLPRPVLEERGAVLLIEGDGVLTLGAGDITSSGKNILSILEGL